MDEMQVIAKLEDIDARGLRFTYKEGPLDEEGILLRLDNGEVRAYKNECRHLPMPLDDREPRDYWDPTGRYLTCNSHGARYQVEDGLCVVGPCQGSHLKTLPIVVEGEEVLLDTSKIGGFFKV